MRGFNSSEVQNPSPSSTSQRAGKFHLPLPMGEGIWVLAEFTGAREPEFDAGLYRGRYGAFAGCLSECASSGGVAPSCAPAQAGVHLQIVPSSDNGRCIPAFAGKRFLTVIARSGATKQSRAARAALDCFAALAMTKLWLGEFTLSHRERQQALAIHCLRRSR